MTINEKMDYLHETFPELIPIGEYNKIKDQITVRCSNCGGVFIIGVKHIMNRRHGCPKCREKPVKITKKIFLDKMQRINPSIEIISDFYSYKIKVTCLCKVDGYIWDASPSMLLSGKGCPKCGRQLGLNAVEMNTLLTSRGFNIVSLEKGFISRSKKSRFKCLSCGDEWNEVFNSIVNRFEYGCKKCKDISILQKVWS